MTNMKMRDTLGEMIFYREKNYTTGPLFMSGCLLSLCHAILRGQPTIGYFLAAASKMARLLTFISTQSLKLVV